MNPPTNVELLRYANPQQLAATAAADWLDLSANRSDPNHPFTVALSGGRFVSIFFAQVAAQAAARPASFAATHFFWADERCVPPDHPDSNYKLAQDTLFPSLSLHPHQIHRLAGEIPPAEAIQQANQAYESLLGKLSPAHPGLDLVLLGMGEDGHIASLFPNATPETLACTTPFLAVDNSPKPPPHRLSLSYAALTAATEVWVLISGATKADALKKSWENSAATPFARLVQLRHDKKVKVLVDF